MANHTKQELVQELPGYYNVIFDTILDEKVGMIDATISSEDPTKKILLVFKEKDQTPAMFGDVKKLERLREIMKGKNYSYMIFCEKNNNPFAEKAAKVAGIEYYKKLDNLVDNIKNYFVVQV